MARGRIWSGAVEAAAAAIAEAAEQQLGDSNFSMNEEETWRTS